MDATTMPSITSLVAKLKVDFPHVNFKAGHEFRWDPSRSTVFFDQATNDVGSLLHEASHAALHHSHYTKDIFLIEMERDAWQYAKTILCAQYQTTIDNDTIQDALDTYRDWLHTRSTCPACQATGVQSTTCSYRCIICKCHWRVNDARACTLRRYICKNEKRPD